MSNDIEPIKPAGQDIESQIQSALAISQAFSSHNIREAVSHDGSRYKHDVKAGTQRVVVQGTCITLRENTIEVLMTRPGASMDGTLAETTKLPQALQGALTGVGQSTVSRRSRKR